MSNNDYNMNPEITQTPAPQQPTEEQLQQRADEISKRLGCKVHPLQFFDDNAQPLYAFVREPNRLVKQRALDAALQKGPMIAAGELLEAVLIKEESDPRVYSEAPENDKYYLGAATAAMELIKVSVDQFKKK